MCGETTRIVQGTTGAAGRLGRRVWSDYACRTGYYGGSGEVGASCVVRLRVSYRVLRGQRGDWGVMCGQTTRVVQGTTGAAGRLGRRVWSDYACRTGYYGGSGEVGASCVVRLRVSYRVLRGQRGGWGVVCGQTTRVVQGTTGAAGRLGRHVWSDYACRTGYYGGSGEVGASCVVRLRLSYRVLRGQWGGWGVVCGETTLVVQGTTGAVGRLGRRVW